MSNSWQNGNGIPTGTARRGGTDSGFGPPVFWSYRGVQMVASDVSPSDSRSKNTGERRPGGPAQIMNMDSMCHGFGVFGETVEVGESTVVSTAFPRTSKQWHDARCQAHQRQTDVLRPLLMCPS